MKQTKFMDKTREELNELFEVLLELNSLYEILLSRYQIFETKTDRLLNIVKRDYELLKQTTYSYNKLKSDMCVLLYEYLSIVKDPIFVRQMMKILKELDYYENPVVDVDSVIHLLLQKYKELVNPEMTEGVEVTNAQVVPFSNTHQNFVPIARSSFIKNLNYVKASPVKGLKELINNYRRTQNNNANRHYQVTGERFAIPSKFPRRLRKMLEFQSRYYRTDGKTRKRSRSSRNSRR